LTQHSQKSPCKLAFSFNHQVNAPGGKKRKKKKEKKKKAKGGSPSALKAESFRELYIALFGRSAGGFLSLNIMIMNDYGCLGYATKWIILRINRMTRTQSCYLKDFDSFLQDQDSSQLPLLSLIIQFMVGEQDKFL
jgi:hypothetical protein